jgi:hypothetical protein
VQRATQDPAE